jgi:hypothetical protein
MARPTKMTPETLGKLERAFSLDASIEQACFYADINPDTYYSYAKATPAFSERIKAVRERLVLTARQTVADNIAKDVKVAQWYLERKSADFRPKSEIIDHGLDETRNKLKEFFDDRNDDTPDEPAAPDDASAEPNAPAEQEATGDVAQSVADIPGI